MKFDIESKIQEFSLIVKNNIMKLVGEEPGTLMDATRYSLLSGGKYLRPYLIIETAKIFNVENNELLNTASAIEMLHCYSLIHDDLPSMDNDDFRRGKPTCHKAFNEATAILAGDNLLTFAFEILSSDKAHSNSLLRCQIINIITKAIGVNGMAGGQMLDIEFENQEKSKEEIILMQKMKTSCLFEVSVEIGCIFGQASVEEKEIFKNFSSKLGLAYQIIDDVLDAEGDEKIFGKKTRKDISKGKATLVNKFGAGYAKEYADKLIIEAKLELLSINRDCSNLTSLADYIICRNL